MSKKAKIGIRYQVGKLTVEGPTEQRKNGYMVWRCRCDCGGELLLDTRALQRGATRDCGCWSHPPLKDFVGKRFGQLTVLEYVGKRAGMHRWKCRCDCGKETVVGQTLLQTGKTKSCGCLQVASIVENLKLCEGTSVAILEASKHRLLLTNTSGYTGVYQNKRTGKWCAQITFKKKTYFLGTYAKKEDAVKARKRGEEMHDNFLEWYHSTYKAQDGEKAVLQPKLAQSRSYGQRVSAGA